MRARTSNRTAISGKDAVVIVRLMPHKEFEVFWTLISRLGNYCLMWIVVAFRVKEPGPTYYHSHLYLPFSVSRLSLTFLRMNTFSTLALRNQAKTSQVWIVVSCRVKVIDSPRCPALNAKTVAFTTASRHSIGSRISNLAAIDGPMNCLFG